MMSFLRRLLGSGQRDDPGAQHPTDAAPDEGLSQEAVACISTALRIIEAQVEIQADVFVVKGAGDAGEVIVAARELEKAHHLHPDDAPVHYAYASGLHLAAQYREARAEMEAVQRNHPGFALARLALEGWDLWSNAFTFPRWDQESDVAHSSIAATLPPGASGLFSVREGILPRAVVFLRDGSSFGDPAALRAARIDLASLISPVRNPQLFGIYARIYDRPGSPFDCEVLGYPFWRRGHRKRSGWEHLCLQRSLGFAIIDARDRVMLNRRIRMPTKMLQTNQRLLEMLAASEGCDISLNAYLSATVRHQRQVSHSDIRY